MQHFVCLDILQLQRIIKIQHGHHETLMWEYFMLSERQLIIDVQKQLASLKCDGKCMKFDYILYISSFGALRHEVNFSGILLNLCHGQIRVRSLICVLYKHTLIMVRFPRHNQMNHVTFRVSTSLNVLLYFDYYSMIRSIT